MAAIKPKPGDSNSNRAKSKPKSGNSSKKSKPSAEKKTKPSSSSAGPKRNKRRTYTDKELGIPQLNMITPAGIQKPHGTKKGKVFVDDSDSMMTILAMVNAEKEGEIESKMMRARQLEEIREARRREQEKRGEEKRSKLEDVKADLRNKKKRKFKGDNGNAADLNDTAAAPKSGKSKKRVSFG